MSRPSFPLSVRREFVYRARIESTGEILQCESLKELFRVVRAHLRTDVLYLEKDFKCASAVLEFGLETLYEEKPNYFYCEWQQFASYGYMYVSTLSESFYRFEDARNCVMRGKYDI